MCSLTDQRDECREAGYIYTLSYEGEVRYIGYTMQKPSERFNEHKTESRSNQRTHKERWIRSVGPENVIMTVIEQYDYPLRSELAAIEVARIAEARAQGLRLVNGTDGGDGGRTWPVGKKHTEETRRRMSEVQRGRKLSEAHRAAIGDSKRGENSPMYGVKHTEETRALMSANRKGKGMGKTPWNKGVETGTLSKETRDKMSAARKGKPLKGNHTMHHTRKNIFNPDCSFCVAGTPKVGQNV